jgi:hypothetical protein
VVFRLDAGLEQLERAEVRVVDQGADHPGREPLPATGGVDREGDRSGGRLDPLEDDRPVPALAAVDGAAIERAAIE